MKLKETTRIIPFVTSGFIILHQNRKIFNWFRIPKNAYLLIASLFLFIPVVPWIKTTSVPLDSRSQLELSKFDSGRLVEIFSPFIPFLFWLLVILTLAHIIFYLIPSKRPKDSSNSLPSGSFFFLGLWSVFCLLGFLFNFKVENNIRYLTTPLIPLAILSFSLFQKPLTLLYGWRRLLLLLWIPIFFQTSLENGRVKMKFMPKEITSARDFSSGVDIADYELTKKLNEDYYQDTEVTWQELDDFYRGKGRVIPASRAIKIKIWNKNAEKRTTPGYLRRLSRKWGAAYILVFENPPDWAEALMRDPNLALVFESTTSNGSFYSKVFRNKKKANRKIFLYKYKD